MTDNTDTTNGPNALGGETTLKFPARLLAVFVEPARLLKEIAVKPDLVLPFIIFIASAIVSYFLSALRVDDTNLMDNFQLDILEEQAFTAFVAVYSVIVSFIGWLISAGILNFLTKFFDSKANFRHFFSLTGYARFIKLIQTSIMFVVLRFSGRQISFSPAVFLAAKDQVAPLGTFLSYLDLFGLFHFVFLGLAFVHVCKISTKKSIGLVVSMWLASLLFSLFLSIKFF